MTVFETAHRLLCEYEASGKYVNLSLNSHLADSIKGESRAALTALLYTTVENKLRYDYFISALSKRSIDKINGRVRNALRLGFCALLDMDRIPDHAAVNESVKLATNAGERAFINGILRTAARERESLPFPEKSKNAARYYSVYYSLPLKTVKFFINEFGEDDAVRIFDRFSEKHKVLTLSVNTLKISREAFIAKLSEHGITAVPCTLSEYSIRLSDSYDPKALPGFNEGEFFVQDEASALASAVLSADRDELIVDTCSAPGGKSFLLAIISSDGADIRSFDIHDSKLSLIESGAVRLGLKSLKIGCRDAREPDSSLIGRADRVICDVPCSGLGVIGKKPDLRYKEIENLSALTELQYEILCVSSLYLKNGGQLVYSTCTLNPAENEKVIERFLFEHSDFEAQDFSLGDIRSERGQLTFMPHIHGTDGFFIAKLRKK